MSNDPYAAPTANLDNSADSAVIQTKPMSAKGRLSVLSYLGQSMVLMLIFAALFGVLGVLAVTLGGGIPTSPDAMESFDFSNPIFIALAVIGVLLYIFIIYITVVMMIKRLHDRNHSGWWALAIFVGSVIPFVNIVAILAMIYVIFFPGQKTGNRFGGRRPTKGWEKVLGILYIVFMVAIIAAAIIGGGAMFMGAAG